MELYHSGQDEDFVKAIPVFEQTLQQDSREMDTIKEAICVLVRAYRIKGDIPKFFGYALKDTATVSSAEVCCELGRYYESTGELQEALIWYQNASTETESILDIATSQTIPQEALKRLGAY